MNAGDPPNYYNGGSNTRLDGDKPLHSLVFGPRLLKAFNQPKQRTDIKSVTYNSKRQKLILLDSRGGSCWSVARNSNSLRRELTFPKFQYNLLQKILYCEEFNVYFALGKDRSLRVYNRNFEETGRSFTDDTYVVTHFLFNPVLNELITGGGCVRFWNYSRVEKNKLNSVAMSNYSLTLRLEFGVEEGGRWCTQMELDVPRQRLYLFSSESILCYDMQGTLLTQLKNTHTGRVMGAVYSPYARVLLTASSDLEIRAWSEVGHLLHIFHGHTKVITGLILHPETSAIFISASLDCSIRFWCLNTLTQLISIPCLEGVVGLGLTEENLLYSWSQRTVLLYNLNHFLDFWGYLRYPALAFRMCKAHGKTNRLLTLGDGSSLHMFSCSTGKKLCLLPPHPFLSPLKELPGFAYDRQSGLIALLLSSWELWVYTARIDPACRVAELDVREFTPQSRARKSTRSVASETQQPKTTSHCCCVGFLNSPVCYESEEGPVCADAVSFLLCGMADGRILFMDIAIRNLLYYQLWSHKDPVVWLHHDLEQNCLLSMCKESSSRLVLTWSLPSLQNLLQIPVPCDITAFTWMEDLFFVGLRSGAVRLVSAADSGDGRGNSGDCTPVHVSHSAGRSDTLIKLWDRQRTLLAEVQLDASLSCACFLNPSGDLLLGFRQHLYKLPHTHLFSSSSDTLLLEASSHTSLTGG
ncbi:uncharacterized protein LOC134456404 [Engraulis encrasicolus]|uniref:uncharacterized protein LOC134456404 n=1 Tax=Engraulis encrasicolus TaxID=184585 RepID=UPI002FD40090